MSKTFENKVTIVTGGASGIGRALCQGLARGGSLVTVADANHAGAQRVADEIAATGGRARAEHLDVTKDADVSDLVRRTVSTYGHLDFMFNNAGIVVTGDARDLTLEHWRRVLDVNLNGAIYGTLAAYEVMAKQASGHIVNTSSAAGLVPAPALAPYCTSKYGVVGLSLALRLEGADLGVRVSVVCPGRVRTDIYQNMVAVNADRKQVLAMVSRYAMMQAPEAARLILQGVARNRRVIVFPASVGWAWRLYRLHPGLVERRLASRGRELRKYRGLVDPVR